jgi:hypothetical protein
MTWQAWRRTGAARFDGSWPGEKTSLEVAELLPALAKEFASRSRRFHAIAGELPFAYSERQLHTTLLPAIDALSDVAFMEQPLQRSKARGWKEPRDRFGWVDYWVSLADAVVLLEVKHAWMSCRSNVVTVKTRQKWRTCADQLSSIREIGAPSIIEAGEPYWAVGLMVAVHFYDGAEPPSLPDRKVTWDRHMKLVKTLGKEPGTKDWPVAWHGVWQLHDNLVVEWGDDKKPWLHCPAVSFVAAARPDKA